jgi:hypothetical protein
LPGVVSNERTDVITQTTQKVDSRRASAPETEARLQQILDSMRLNPPPDADDDLDTLIETGPDGDKQGTEYPSFMRLPSQGRASMTRLGQAMVDRGLITPDDLERALEHQRLTRKRLG